MARGRPRQRDPSIPAHIDQHSLPRGVYWKAKDRVWFSLIYVGDRRTWKRLGGAELTLLDLQVAMDALRGVDRSSLGWLCDQFNGSPQFARLAETTRDDYSAQRKLVKNYKTKRGTLETLPYGHLTPVFFQTLIDKIGAEHPSKANHLLRYIRRVYSWAHTRVGVKSNPVAGVEQAVERKRQRLPKPTAYLAVVNYARANFVPYLWIATELAFLLRLRGIETVTLTDAHVVESGIITNRRKGSEDSLIRWSPRLREAYAAAVAERARIWTKKRIPTPIDPEQRPILVNAHGKPVTRKALSTIWQTCIRAAMDAGIIDRADRFSLHDAKRKGVTDTKGTKAEKKLASGHKSDSMMAVYDKEVPEVSTPGGV